eukprot:1375044-Amorphochlora_amoeboformis.AAC.2
MPRISSEFLPIPSDEGSPLGSAGMRSGFTILLQLEIFCVVVLDHQLTKKSKRVLPGAPPVELNPALQSHAHLELVVLTPLCAQG